MLKQHRRNKILLVLVLVLVLVIITMQMTWAQAAAWVWGHDGGKELLADNNAGQRIEAAAAELGLMFQHEPDEQLLILFRFG